MTEESYSAGIFVAITLILITTFFIFLGYASVMTYSE